MAKLGKNDGQTVHFYLAIYSKDEQHHDKRVWWSYILYYNEDDPRTFVPRWGGFNVNIARPGGIALWVGFLVFIGVMVYITR